MQNKTIPYLCIFFVSFLFFMAPLLPQTSSPPGQPFSGYGSEENMITTTYNTYTLGDARDGSRVWFYEPTQLKNTTSAPVIVYLHGWTAYSPSYYIGKIEHYLYQGYIVIYPQYQKSGLLGIANDADQNIFLTRAIMAVELALKHLDLKAERENLYVVGHSLGGLLAYCWNAHSPTSAKALLLENASLEPDDDIPENVEIIPLDWRSAAPKIHVPVFFLTGIDDPLYPESLLGAEKLLEAPIVNVYLAKSDDHGKPSIVAGHAAPLANRNLDTLDYRYYLAALDAILDGQTALSFDLGQWSDGTALTPVEQMY